MTLLQVNTLRMTIRYQIFEILTAKQVDPDGPGNIYAFRVLEFPNKVLHKLYNKLAVV